MDLYNAELLKKLDLFHDIQPKDFPSLLHCIGAFQKAFQKSEYIVLDGSQMSQVGVVLTGKIQMIKEDCWGNKNILSVIYPGDVFGESIVCGSLSSSIVSFQAAEDSHILFLPFHRVLCSCSRSCKFHQQLIENMVEVIAEKNVRLMEKMEIVSKKTIRERVLAYLSQQVQKEGKLYVQSDMGRLDLADYLCVDRSALTRELARMKKEGIIDFEKNTFLLKS